MDVSDAPQFLPDLVFDMIFSNLELADLFSCMLVCKNWSRAINDDGVMLWKSMCRREMPKQILESKLLSQLHSPKDKLRALYHSWSEDDSSISVQQKGFIIYRHPTPGRTDLARTKIGYNNGKHVWEITWTEPLGTVAMVGVSTKKAPVYCDDYLPLLGATKHGWGWNLVDNVLLHNGKPHGEYPLLTNAPKYQIGEKLQLVLDFENGTLHFEKCNQFLGIAFQNLPKTKLYPSVSVVYGGAKISAVYIDTKLYLEICGLKVLIVSHESSHKLISGSQNTNYVRAELTKIPMTG